jgi:hypothetical protein
MSDLNISYISSNGVAEKFAENLAKIISISKFLLHLDISGLSLNENIKPIIKSVRDSKQLISVHCHDNCMDPKVKDWVMRTMGIETQDYHKL